MILDTHVGSLCSRVMARRRQRLGGTILITLAALCLGVAALTTLTGVASSLEPLAPVDPVIVSAVPTAGVIAFTIPRGAADVQQAGGRAYVMPATMRFAVGDK